ncbi:MAG: lasso peptide biosynthesis B2 protein [Gemmatimonadota bacterium]
MSLFWSFRILTTSLVLPLLLRLVPFDRLAEKVGRRRSSRTPSQAQQLAIAARVDRVLGLLPPPWRRTCLTRSIVLYHLLRRNGLPVELCLGVRRGVNGMDAHAWLELNNGPYLEPATEAGFEIIARFPAGATLSHVIE